MDPQITNWTPVIQALMTVAFQGARSVTKWKQENPKSGWKTTEFWTWLLGMIATSLGGYT